MLCPNCQNEISMEAKACPKCGQPILGQSSPKSRTAATLLCLFFGVLGIHRFYVGKTGSGLAQLGLLLFAIFGGGLAIVPMVFGAIAGDMGAFAGGGVAYLAGLASGLILSFWIFVDLIMVICGIIRDKDGRRVDRW